MAARNIYMATESRVVDFGGTRVAIQKGRTTAETGAPILDAYPELFAPIVAHHKASGSVPGGRVEQATAAPGERRDAPPKVAKKATVKKAEPKPDDGAGDGSDDAGRGDGDGADA